MGYIRESKNVDLVVAPSILTEEAKHAISDAIAQYKKTGKEPASIVSKNARDLSANLSKKTSSSYKKKRVLVKK